MRPNASIGSDRRFYVQELIRVLATELMRSCAFLVKPRQSSAMEAALSQVPAYPFLLTSLILLVFCALLPQNISEQPHAYLIVFAQLQA